MAESNKAKLLAQADRYEQLRLKAVHGINTARDTNTYKITIELSVSELTDIALLCGNGETVIRRKAKYGTDLPFDDRWIDAKTNPPPIVDERSKTSSPVLILRENGSQDVAFYCYDDEGNYWTSDDEKTMYE